MPEELSFMSRKQSWINATSTKEKYADDVADVEDDDDADSYEAYIMDKSGFYDNFKGDCSSSWL